MKSEAKLDERINILFEIRRLTRPAHPLNSALCSLPEEMENGKKLFFCCGSRELKCLPSVRFLFCGQNDGGF